MIKCAFILISSLLTNLSLSAQCPDRGDLWRRIVILRDSSKVPPADQLKELKGYLDITKDCPHINDSTQSLLLLRIGWLFSKINDFKNAIAFTLRSIDLIQKYSSSKNINEAHLIKCYYNLYLLYDSTGQEKLKIQALDNCISVSIRLKTGYEYAHHAISEEIDYNFAKGDYYKCVDFALTGERITISSQYHLQELDYYIIWRINSLVYLHEYDSATSLAKKAMKECISKSNTTYVGSYLLLLAYIAAEKNDSVGAIRFSKRSIQNNLKYKNFDNCAATYNNLALYLYIQQLNDNDKALYYYIQALIYANPNYSIEILNNIANLYVRKHDFENAFGFYKKAFNKIFPDVEIDDILNKSAEDILAHTQVQYVIKLTLDLADANLEKFKQTKNRSNLISAIGILKTADRMMDKIKISQTDLHSKLFWRSETRRLYEYAVESSFLDNKPNDAFYFIEKSRASLLIDQLKEQATGDSNIVELAIVKKNIY